MRRRRVRRLLGCLAFVAVRAASAGDLELSYQALDLPGAPAQIVAVELDGDPGPELAVVVAYTAWEEIALEEVSEIDAVEGLVAAMTIVPALLERRELWLFDRQAGGAWQPWADADGPLELGADVLTLEATGHPEVSLLVLTDSGADAIRPREDGAGLERVPLVEAPTVLARSGAFLPNLQWVYDLDGDPWPDLLLPAADGWRVYSGTEAGFASRTSQRLAYPDFDDVRTPRRRDLPLPRVRDVDDDGRPELLAPHPSRGWNEFFVYRNQAGSLSPALGPFGLPAGPDDRPPADADSADEEAPEQRVVFFDDLDGDGRAEYVTQEEIGPEAAGMKEMAHAKTPPQRYRVFDAAPDLSMSSQPRLEFVTDGYSFPGPSEIRLPGGLWDLDGDGRRDLVTLTLDFSILQAVRVLVTRSIKIGLDFHLLCQRPDGSFAATSGLDLSGEFRLNLKNFRLGQLSLFAGDFDGDGRRDFVQMGRGRTVSIHRGVAGCRFPTKPDLELELVEAPKDLALVEVRDLDGDGLADLAITQPQRRKGIASRPVRLDLYLSGGPR